MHEKNSGYDIEKQIYESPSSILYRATERTSGRVVILKTMVEGNFPAENIAKLQGEYQRMMRVENPQVLRALDFVQQDGTYYLVTEYFEGESLAAYISRNTMSIQQFLEIAPKIILGIAAIHGQGMIHKDINPANILYDAQTGEVKIIDFGISTEYQFERNDEIQINMGTLRYISPEQTRRMNRAIDFRTDFYSLGITFYEMLCGKVPFDSESPMGLIYSHLAKIPPSVQEVRKDIPLVLSQMVAKLMEKMPEDRYISDTGILYDIKQCAELIDEEGKITLFTIATHDYSEQLEISKRIYGRKHEINRLLSVYDEFMMNGKCLLTIGGYSGTGKTTLVSKLHSEIAKADGLFLEGKFDQYQKNIPYYALFKAIEQLCDMMLSESASSLECFRTVLFKALGQDENLLARRIPKVAQLFAMETESEITEEEMVSVEERIRFKNVLAKFFSVTASFVETLVLFLDDVHLADMASLEILEMLMMNEKTHGIFVIASFRDNETGNDHSVLRTLQKIRFGGGCVRHIAIKGIEKNAVWELIEDSLHSNREESSELAEVVYEKTHGNPFYVIQMLRHCHTQRLIFFSKKSNCFVYNIEKIRKVPFEDNVVDFLIQRASELPRGTVRLLSMGAIVGQIFNSDILAYMAEERQEVINEQLRQAVSLEIISPKGLSGSSKTEYFTFCHDRFQQAYYLMMKEEERLQSYLKVADFYEKNLSGKTPSAEITLKIAENYAKGLSAITVFEKRTHAAAVVLEAVRVSSGLSAFDTAMRFLEILLSECLDVQEKQEGFQFSLYAAYHATLCSLSQYEQADEVYEKLRTMKSIPLEMTEICCDQAVILSNRGQYAQAIALGLRFLETCGIHYPADNLEKAVEEELNAYYTELSSEDFSDIEHVVETSDPIQYAVNKVANRIFAASLFGNPLDSFWLAITTARRILKNGYTPDGLQLYANQIVPLVFLRGDFKTPCLAAESAIRIAEKKNYRNVLGRFYHCYSLMCHHWYKKLSDGLPFARSAFEYEAEIGDFEFACYSYCTAQEILLETAENLNELYMENSAAMAYAEKHSNNHALQIYCNYGRIYKVLKGKTEENGSFQDVEFEEQSYVQSIAENVMAIFFYNTLRSLSALLFEDIETAYTLTKQATLYESYVTGFYITAQCRFLHGLVICRKLAQAECPEEIQPALWEKLLENNQWLKARASDAPMNFEHMYLTIDGGIAALKGRDCEALEKYNKAACVSKDNGFICHNAMIMEIAGRHLLHMQAGDIASLYIRESYLSFLSWGALAKGEQMKQRYPEILSDEVMEATINNRTDYSTTGSLTAVTLDLDAIMQASQAITKEIHLEDILKQLMHVLLENAGAQKIFFLTEQEGCFEIRAQGHGKGDKLEISTASAAMEGDLPYQIIHYVFRTGESIVLDNIHAEKRFVKDEYFERHLCKSVMCLPVVNKGKTIGILYLENNVIEGAFQKDRVEFLNVLTSQLAISLENAQLYDNIYRLAYYDSLTELPNRAAMYEQLQKWSDKNDIQQKNCYAVLIIDLDNFKAINDTFGHTFGDLLLQRMGGFMKNFSAGRGTVSRIGGDEFLIAITKAEWVERMEALAGELLNRLSRPFCIEDVELYISASIGMAIYPKHGETLDTLMRNADTALYSAKEDGKNTYKIFSEDMQSRIAKRLEMENRLRKAVSNEEFVVYYQPKVDGKTGKTVGAEALVRWNSPILGMVAPVQFIPIAEDSGVIVSIDDIVLTKACRMAKSLEEAEISITISVNRSAVHFKKLGLVDRVRKALEREGLPPGLLEIEITESAAMQNLELTVSILEELRDLGVKVSLDDFGTGYSSLSHLRQLPITTLKIDKSFIDGVGAEENESSIVEALIDLAHKMKLTVVAEGVESEAQFTFLNENCCDLIQGYYFSKPLPEEMFLQRLLSERDSTV